MRLDLSLCGMWYCEALVLLVGVFLQCRVLALPRVYCVICTMYAAACSIRVVVYSELFDYIPFRSFTHTTGMTHFLHTSVSTVH